MRKAEESREAGSERSQLISHLKVGCALTPIQFVAVYAMKSLVSSKATGKFRHDECTVRLVEGQRCEFGDHPDLFTEEQGEPWDQTPAVRVALIGEDRFLDQCEYWLKWWVTEGRKREKAHPKATLERDGWEAVRSGHSLTVTLSKEQQR